MQCFSIRSLEHVIPVSFVKRLLAITLFPNPVLVYLVLVEVQESDTLLCSGNRKRSDKYWKVRWSPWFAECCMRGCPDKAIKELATTAIYSLSWMQQEGKSRTRCCLLVFQLNLNIHCLLNITDCWLFDEGVSSTSQVWKLGDCLSAHVVLFPYYKKTEFSESLLTVIFKCRRPWFRDSYI
jgi:hypothetical protein